MSAAPLSSNHFDNRTILIVNGYLRDIMILFKLLSNWVDRIVIIPDEIIHLCIAYYIAAFHWDLQDLEQENSRMIKVSDTKCITIPLNQIITNKMCDTFELEITQTKSKAYKDNGFCFGFCRGYIPDHVDKNHQMNRIPGNVCVRIDYKTIWFYDKDNGIDLLHIKELKKAFQSNCKIKMMIDFKMNRCRWIWIDYEENKNEELATTSIDVEFVCPVFSPYAKGNEYEITDYSFS